MRRNATLAALAIAILTIPPTVEAEIIGRWSFPDQGPTSNANLSATFSSPGAIVGPIQIGPGHAQIIQNVSGTNYSYIDASQNGGEGTHVGGDTSSAPYYMVGDWNSGAPGGGNIVQDNGAVDHTVNPSGAGPLGSGALYLHSLGADRNDIPEAIANGLYMYFNVTASGGDWDITDFSFYGTRDSNNPDRAWQTWHLQVDTGSGFSTIFTSAADAIPSNETWGLNSADPFSVQIEDGETATFRLLGTTTYNNAFGRETAFDDLLLQGIFTPNAIGPVVPEPKTAVLWSVVMALASGHWLYRRRARAIS